MSDKAKVPNEAETKDRKSFLGRDDRARSSPYNDQWEKDVMRLNKRHIIWLLRIACLERDENEKNTAPKSQ